MSDDMIIVGLFDNPDSAHLARLRLEFAGIEGHVLDQHIVATNPLYSPAVGGVQLAVRPADFEAATAALETEPVGIAEVRRCPSCESAKVVARVAGRGWAFLMIGLLGFPIGRSRRKFTCETCDHTWRAS